MLNNKKLNEGEDMCNDQQPSKLINIIENRGRIELYLRGIFGDPRDSTNELIALEKLSEEYDTLLIHINSFGGNSSLMTELINIAKKFPNIITIGAGDVASAGAVLWSIGDVRVLTEYTSVMYHRESYFFGGKTDQHLEYATHNNALYLRMIDELCGHILTPTERDRAKVTEVYFTDTDLIERGAAITYEQFIKFDSIVYDVKPLVMIDGYVFIKNDGGSMTVVEDIELGDTMKESELRYLFLQEAEDEENEVFDAEVIDNDDQPLTEDEELYEKFKQFITTEKGEI